MQTQSLKVQIMRTSVNLIAAMVGVGVVGILGSVLITRSFQIIPDTNLPNLVAINHMIAEIRAARFAGSVVAIDGISEEDTKIFLGYIDKAKQNYEVAVKEYLDSPFEDSFEEALYNDLAPKALEQIKRSKDLAELGLKNPVAGSPEWTAMTQLAFKEIPKRAAEIDEIFKKLEDYHFNSAAKNISNAHLIAILAFAVSILIILIASFTGYSLSKKFSMQLSDSLLAVSGALSEASQQVAAAATEISASSHKLSSSSTEQASSLAETAASIEEMSSMVAKNSENSRAAAGVSQQAQDTASRGQQGVQSMISSMDEIAQTNEQVTEIVKVIREIGDKTKVINDIVFQTKLLSFNASVEAARAGEHGKGFAVVAEEVGNLAQMSGNAAKQIGDLLEASVARVEKIVEVTKVKVEAGTVTAHESGEILNEIVSNISKVAVMASDISTASSEQATGVAEITKAMNQLDQVTQQNAATSEESASAAEELSAQTDSLSNLVEQLITLVNGTGDNQAAPQKRNVIKPQSNIIPIASARQVTRRPKATAQNSKPSNMNSDKENAPQFDDERFKSI